MADNLHVPIRQRIRALPGLAVIAAACAMGLSCGGGSSTPTEPTDPVLTNTITISASGVSPKDIQITAGTRVLFTNSDSRTHNMASDPHPDHTDCPEINNIGLIATGQTKETGNLNAIRLCRFHDHDLPNSENLKGTITIR